MMKKISLTTWIILALIAITIVLFIVNMYQAAKLGTQENFIGAMNDTLKVVRDKDSGQIATIQAFQIYKADDLLKLQSKDSSIINLQKALSENKSMVKNGGTVTVIKTEGQFNQTVPSQHDTVYVPQTNTFEKVYTGNFNLNEWAKGTIIARPDSVSINMTIKDAYDVIVGYDKNVPTVKVKNYNPYITITELRSVNIMTPKPKKLGLGFTVGYGATINSGIVKTGISGSVGITYNLIPIR